MHKIDLPIKVPVSKKRNFSLNMNAYRNAHYQTLNKAKVIFKKMISPFLGGLPRFNKVELTYILYPGTKHLQDISNVCCVADKFFCDAMTETGKWEDDNYIVISKVSYLFGSVDKENPRIEVYIKELEP